MALNMLISSGSPLNCPPISVSEWHVAMATITGSRGSNCVGSWTGESRWPLITGTRSQKSRPSEVRVPVCNNNNTTAELSQRRPCDAPNTWVLWKVLRVLTTHPATFPENCNGPLLRSILIMCVQNLKFVALPVPEIIAGTQKIWAVPRPIFSQNFKGLLFEWTLWIYLPNLKFVASPVPEIIGGTQKIWGVPGFAHPPYSPKFLKGFC